MKAIENPSETEEGEVGVRFGLNIGSNSPEFALPVDAVAALADDDWDELGSALEDWWDNLSMEERARAMKLNEKKGWELVENLMWVDTYDEDTDRFEPVYEG
jgi:hypothetical protein